LTITYASLQLSTELRGAANHFWTIAYAQFDRQLGPAVSHSIFGHYICFVNRAPRQSQPFLDHYVCSIRSPTGPRSEPFILWQLHMLQFDRQPSSAAKPFISWQLRMLNSIANRASRQSHSFLGHYVNFNSCINRASQAQPFILW